jgi:hypothetical protein
VCHRALEQLRAGDRMAEDPRYEAGCQIGGANYLIQVCHNHLTFVPFHGGWFSGAKPHPEEAEHIFTKDIADVVLRPAGLFSHARLTIILEDDAPIELTLYDKNQGPELQESILEVLKHR